MHKKCTRNIVIKNLMFFTTLLNQASCANSNIATRPDVVTYMGYAVSIEITSTSYVVVVTNVSKAAKRLVKPIAWHNTYPQFYDEHGYEITSINKYVAEPVTLGLVHNVAVLKPGGSLRCAFDMGIMERRYDIRKATYVNFHYAPEVTLYHQRGVKEPDSLFTLELSSAKMSL